MGCDIHCIIEYSDFTYGDHAKFAGEPYWSAMGSDFNPGRDYTMFGILADVRCGGCLFPPRGLPGENASWQVKDHLKEDGDLHSHSWLTHDELAQCLAEYTLKAEWGPYSVVWDAILAAMRAFQERGQPTRLVFAFDN
jgi:hypothetical protein